MKHLIKTGKLSSTRQIALEKLETMGLPTKKTEEYRYFDTRDLLKKEWDLVEDNDIKPTQSKEIIIVDGKLYSYPSDLGFEIFYSEEAVIDEEHFDSMYYLGHTLSEKNLHINFKSDCSVTLRHVFSTEEKMIPYRISLNIAENIYVKLFDILEDMDTKGIFVSSGYDISVGKDATFTLIQEKTTYENGSTYIFSHDANVEPFGTFNLHTFDFGEGRSLQLINAKAKEEANINSYHLLFAKEEANIGTISKIVHQGKNSKSTQKAKNILQDKAKGIFDALINIQNSAKGSITHQNSQAILLNDGAFMASKPQLEIYIDDVEASHGSTIGELDKDQLFYLRSRGIQETEAKKLLILAFANEMIDNLENDKIKEYLHQSFDRAYYDEIQLECLSTCHNCEEMVFKEK